jgi:DNA-binding IclR family transcriptional regulator
MLLCRRHGLKVLCIHQTVGRSAPAIVGYERGRAMSLYLAATSKAVMAHLDDDVLRQLIADDAAGLKSAGLPTRLKALSELMADWRSTPVIETQAEVNPDAHGWGVPLFQGRHLLGSLTVVLSRSSAAVAVAAAPDQLLRARSRIEARLDEAAAR